MIMKKKWILTLNVLLLSSFFSSNQILAKDPEFEWRMITTWPKTLSIFHDGVEKFAHDIKVISNGRLEIKIKNAEEIKSADGKSVTPLRVFDAVSSGDVEMGHSAAYYWAEKVPGSQFMASVPFGMTAKGMNAWLYQGGGLELWRELYKPFNIVPFPMGNTGVQMAGWFNKKITKLSDFRGFRGLKMRIPGLGGKVLERIGAEPKLLAAEDIYSALKKGDIDAAEWIGPFQDLQLKLYEVAKYYYYPGWHEPGTTLELLINKPAWKRLPADLQKVIEAVSSDVNQYIYTRFESQNLSALRELREQWGVIVLEIPEKIIDELSIITRAIMLEKSAKNSQFRRIYEAYDKFNNDNIEWTRIADDKYSSGRTDSFEDVRRKEKFPDSTTTGGTTTIPLKDDIVTFATNSATIKKIFHPEIKRITNELLRRPSSIITIEGHTDNLGSKNANMNLSWKRAIAVKQIMIQQGLNESQIKVMPFGESKPVDSNESESGRKRNRRVEIKVMNKP